MIPIEIVYTQEKYSEDDYDICIKKVEKSDTSLILNLELQIRDPDESNEINKNWEIVATGYRESHIDFKGSSIIALKDDHPLLWEFTDIHCQLYFSGQCQDVPKLLHDLYLKHKALFGSHKHFSIAAEESTHFKPFKYTSGMLATGSKELMQVYAGCLKKNGLDYTIIGEREPMHWDGKKYLPRNVEMKVFFVGESFIIAEDFIFRQY